jgi:hypothetical protein
MTVPSHSDETLQRAAEVLFRQYESEYSTEHLTWRDFADPAREILDAAAPLLAEECARAVEAHMEKHDPAGWPGVTWRRHFRIAARAAAGAFTTEAESKQQAVEALASGNYLACTLPEDGVPR